MPLIAKRCSLRLSANAPTGSMCAMMKEPIEQVAIEIRTRIEREARAFRQHAETSGDHLAVMKD